jgi:hypothetical protein
MKLLRLFLCICLIYLLTAASCKKPPYKPDFSNIKGLVIGKETCNTDKSKDFWLLDMTVKPDTPQYGDTLTLNGTTYTNVLKTKQLVEQFKVVGLRVSIDYREISNTKIVTSGCDVAIPVIYQLKELFILNQFEIR